jgi:phosphatidate cytidylyltransferase
MLRWRLLLGPVMVAALLGLGWLDARADRPGIYLFPLAVVLALAGAQELLALFAARNLRPLRWAVLGGTLLVVLSNAGPLFWPAVAQRWLSDLGWPLAAFLLGMIAIFLGEMARFQQPGQVLVQTGLAVLALAYVGLLVSMIVQLRLLAGGELGVVAVAALVWTVKMADIGAYAVGRLWGRHKLAPRLSPGKTVEGFVGGLAGGCVGAWAVFAWVRPALVSSPSSAPAWGWLVFGLVVSVAGVLGDLAESLIKRDMGRKDSSTWMPGFGGVLDLLDSALLAAPVAYLLWAFGLVG